jgi:ankyrin repeat protein
MMTRAELQDLWSKTLRAEVQSEEEYDRLVDGVRRMYNSDDRFREHIKNRFHRVSEHTGQPFDPGSFDLPMARAFIADETGFASWDELTAYITNPSNTTVPMLFRYAVAALWRGDFTALEQTIGRERFYSQIEGWFEKGYFADEPETFAEAFAASCWLGQTKAAGFLLDKGVDPYAGVRTGLSGFHWAASSGQLEIIKLLIERRVPMEVKGMYNNTVLGQALYSAANEHTDQHADIVKALLEAGAHVWPGTWSWWQDQVVPSPETKEKISSALKDFDPKAHD